MAAQERQYSGAKSEVRTSALCLAFLLGGGGGEGGGGLPHLPADVGKPPSPADSVGLCQLPRMEEHGQLLEDNPSPSSSQSRRPPCSGVPQAGPGATVPVEGSCCSTGPKREKKLPSLANLALPFPAPPLLPNLLLTPNQGGCRFSGAGHYRLDCICLGINNLLLDGQSEFN